ncbi:uncharacterized protein EAE97_004441 [Botrytis byssoidea]|uniref:Uncharacterized protein n=1 Tax=Botrytis byssoidea TaxID=139641 RepID=A0A9P5M431_9HELO|nr:uncharacterized protein EAE97_004441 [Botrytis byssoidea]KAF7947192.1 hypothetical protein EAE97_004441 [Botrytis byssoidea]
MQKKIKKGRGNPLNCTELVSHDVQFNNHHDQCAHEGGAFSLGISKYNTMIRFRSKECEAAMKFEALEGDTDRKGKERKGKERKGKERKGKLCGVVLDVTLRGGRQMRRECEV